MQPRQESFGSPPSRHRHSNSRARRLRQHGFKQNNQHVNPSSSPGVSSCGGGLESLLTRNDDGGGEGNLKKNLTKVAGRREKIWENAEKRAMASLHRLGPGIPSIQKGSRRLDVDGSKVSFRNRGGSKFGNVLEEPGMARKKLQVAENRVEAEVEIGGNANGNSLANGSYYQQSVPAPLSSPVPNLPRPQTSTSPLLGPIKPFPTLKTPVANKKPLFLNPTQNLPLSQSRIQDQNEFRSFSSRSSSSAVKKDRDRDRDAYLKVSSSYLSALGVGSRGRNAKSRTEESVCEAVGEKEPENGDIDLRKDYSDCRLELANQTAPVSPQPFNHQLSNISQPPQIGHPKLPPLPPSKRPSPPLKSRKRAVILNNDMPSKAAVGRTEVQADEVDELGGEESDKEVDRGITVENFLVGLSSSPRGRSKNKGKGYQKKSVRQKREVERSGGVDGASRGVYSVPSDSTMRVTRSRAKAQATMEVRTDGYKAQVESQNENDDDNGDESDVDLLPAVRSVKSGKRKRLGIIETEGEDEDDEVETPIRPPKKKPRFGRVESLVRPEGAFGTPRFDSLPVPPPAPTNIIRPSSPSRGGRRLSTRALVQQVPFGTTEEDPPSFQRFASPSRRNEDSGNRKTTMVSKSGAGPLTMVSSRWEDHVVSAGSDRKAIESKIRNSNSGKKRRKISDADFKPLITFEFSPNSKRRKLNPTPFLSRVEDTSFLFMGSRNRNQQVDDKSGGGQRGDKGPGKKFVESPSKQQPQPQCQNQPILIQNDVSLKRKRGGISGSRLGFSTDELGTEGATAEKLTNINRSYYQRVANPVSNPGLHPESVLGIGLLPPRKRRQILEAKMTDRLKETQPQNTHNQGKSKIIAKAEDRYKPLQLVTPPWDGRVIRSKRYEKEAPSSQSMEMNHLSLPQVSRSTVPRRIAQPTKTPTVPLPPKMVLTSALRKYQLGTGSMPSRGFDQEVSSIRRTFDRSSKKVTNTGLHRKRLVPPLDVRKQKRDPNILLRPQAFDLPNKQKSRRSEQSRGGTPQLQIPKPADPRSRSRTKTVNFLTPIFEEQFSRDPTPVNSSPVVHARPLAPHRTNLGDTERESDPIIEINVDSSPVPKRKFANPVSRVNVIPIQPLQLRETIIAQEDSTIQGQDGYSDHPKNSNGPIEDIPSRSALTKSFTKVSPGTKHRSRSAPAYQHGSLNDSHVSEIEPQPKSFGDVEDVISVSPKHFVPQTQSDSEKDQRKDKPQNHNHDDGQNPPTTNLTPTAPVPSKTEVQITPIHDKILRPQFTTPQRRRTLSLLPRSEFSLARQRSSSMATDSAMGILGFAASISSAHAPLPFTNEGDDPNGAAPGSLKRRRTRPLTELPGPASFFFPHTEVADNQSISTRDSQLPPSRLAKGLPPPKQPEKNKEHLGERRILLEDPDDEEAVEVPQVPEYILERRRAKSTFLFGNATTTSKQRSPPFSPSPSPTPLPALLPGNGNSSNAAFTPARHGYRERFSKDEIFHNLPFNYGGKRFEQYGNLPNKQVNQRRTTWWAGVDKKTLRETAKETKATIMIGGKVL